MSDINIKLNLGDPAESVRGIAIEARDIAKKTKDLSDILVKTNEKGLFIVDSNLNIGYKIDESSSSIGSNLDYEIIDTNN